MHQEGSSSAAARGSSDGSNGKLRLRAYAKVNGAEPVDGESPGIPVMVSITTLPGITEQRTPVDLVVVLHIHEDNSLPSNSGKLLQDAMSAIVESLDATDGLAVIPGQSALMKPRTAWQSSPDNPRKIPCATTSLVASLESAELILHGRELNDKKRRAGDIVVISNSKDDTSPLLAWRFRSIHAFGFREAHNARTMHDISSSRSCTYAVLDDSLGKITQAFFATISRISSGATIAATPIEVKLMCEQTVVLTAVGTPGMTYYISYDKKAGIIWPSAHLHSLTTTNILVYLGGDLQRPKDLPHLCNIHVKHGYGNKVVDDKLDVQLVEEGSDGSKEMAAEIVRMKAVKIVTSIVVTMDDKNSLEQLHAATDNLRQQWRLLESCGKEAGAERLISGLAAQMREMEVRLYNNYYWLEYMLSWRSHQQCQLPLPQLLMDKQSANDPLLQLRILAKLDPIQRTIQEHQIGLSVPVVVSVKAPEAGLAMVERASIDLIIVIDVGSYAIKEKKKKTQEKLQLLKEANEMEAQHKKAKKTVDESERRVEKRLNWFKMKEQFTKKSLELMKDQITLKTLEIKDQITMNRVNTWKREKKEEITERRKDMEETIKEKKSELEEEETIKEKRMEMNTMANTMKELRAQATELEKDVNEVKENINKRLDLLAEAIEIVKNKLSVNDRLAIIPVKSYLDEPATDLFERETSNKVQQLSRPLTYNRTTALPEFCKTDESCKALHWRKQPEKTMRLIRDCLHSAASSSTPTVTAARSQGTDSMTAHSLDVGGSTKTLKKALMDATKILDDRQGKDKDQQGFIIVISDSDDDSICMENLSPKYTVHAFGFYGLHNIRAMYHIASSSNGIYNIINDDSNQITEAFTSCINRMTSTIAVNTKVEIMCSPSSCVVLSTIDSGPFRYSIHDNKKSSSILLGTLSAGTVKNFIVYVDNVHEADHDDFSKCFKVCVRWMHPLDRAGEKPPLEGQVFVVRDGIDDKEVMETTAHVEAVQIARNITDPNYSQTTVMADKLSQMCIKCPEFERSAGKGRLTWLSREMIKIDENKHMAVTNSSYYKNMVADKLAYVLSWLSYQQSYCWISVL